MLRAGTPLGDGYRAAAQDTELLSLREQIRLQAAREHELVRRIGDQTGESGSGWRRAATTQERLEQAIAAQDAGAVQLAVSELRTVLRQGRALEGNWDELREVAALRARLIETEDKLLERGRQLYPVEQVLYMLGVVAAAAVRCIPDRKATARFIASVQAVVDGRAVHDGEIAEVLNLTAPIAQD